MKLQTAINKLEKSGFEVETKMENRSYIARQNGKSTITISADRQEDIYYVAYVEETDETADYEDIALTHTIVKNLTQAIKFA